MNAACISAARWRRSIGAPPGLTSLFAGSAGAFQQSLAGQPFLICAALLAIYIVLGMLYESYIHPLTILSTLPSAGIGGLLALMLLHYDFSLIALIGVILLIGIVKKNGIMMVDQALALEAEGADPQTAIFKASMTRFRPIMMTTLVTLLAALPLAFGNGAPGASTPSRAAVTWVRIGLNRALSLRCGMVAHFIPISRLVANSIRRRSGGLPERQR